MKYKCTLQERWFTEDRITFNEQQLLRNISKCGNTEAELVMKGVFTELLNFLRFKAFNNE